MIRTLYAASAIAATLALAGCATTQVDAQWRNVDLPPNYLRGAVVLVNCETGEDVVRRICEDQVAADLGARGVRAVLAPPLPSSAAPGGLSDMQFLPAARDTGALAVFSVSVGQNSQRVSQGVQVGIGGFGFGRGGGGGIGVSAPIGGGEVSEGYAANGRVTDVKTGRLMWTARASSPPSSDVNAQMAALSRSVMDAAGASGLF